MLHTSALTLFLDGAPLLTLPPLRVAPGEVLTLMGPSGCGKSSLLAALAGVLPPGGPIRLTGDILLGTHRLTPLPPQERGVGILFQDDLLFAHLTVAENLMFGMPAHLKGMAARQTRAHEALAEVGLEAPARGALRRPESPRQPAASPAGRAQGIAAGRTLLPPRQAAAGGIQNPGVRAPAHAGHPRPAGDPRRRGCAGHHLATDPPSHPRRGAPPCLIAT